MKLCILPFFPLLILVTFTLPIQGQDTISGIVNHYASVQYIDGCTGRLVVDEAGPISARDTLLLIQMQGAAINLSNTSNFGQVTDLNGAGLFEPVVVDTVIGDTIQTQFRLLNEYDPAGKVQLVRIPYYDHAVVEGTLRAQPWDGNTGGIVAVFARSISLQADIDVSGQGFWGGSAELDYDGDCSWIFNYNEYRYEAGSIRAGGKGEGIAGLPGQWPRGRGPGANGGGGGNDHNSGGGGGSHLIAGGGGGENNNPSFFGCQGPNPGLAGWPLPMMDDRLFLGGGGGAGHGNNDVATDGGMGGGILILMVEELQGNGFAILANGADAETAGGDGAGGGGAGGTIFIASDAIENTLAIEALGGQGGDADNNNVDQCFGPGGGGSGGRVLGTFPMDVTVDVFGGSPGMSFDSSECPDSPNGATPGQTGTLSLPLPFTYSVDPITGPPQADFDFTVDGLSVQFDNLGNGVSYQWDFGDGNNSLETDPLHVYTQPGSYTVTLITINPSCEDTAFLSKVISLEALPQAAANFAPGEGCAPLQVQFTSSSTNADSIRWVFPGGSPATTTETTPTVTYQSPGTFSVVLIASNGPNTDTLTLSDTIRVVPLPVAEFEVQPNGQGINIDNFSTADTFEWSFGDGNTSGAFEPEHIYDTPGQYEVVLIAENECGRDTTTTVVTIGTAPLPAISIEGSSSGCAPKTLLLSNSTTGFYDSLRWELPGAVPAFSTAESLSASYGQPGNYTVHLRVYSPFGVQEISAENLVTVYAPPVSDFSFEIDGLTVSFTNLSTQAVSYVWNFDDGNSSQLEDPVHTYDQPGFYDVTLNASNPNCARSSTQGIFLDPTSSKEAGRPDDLLLFPNPASDQICLLDESKRFAQGQWQFFNAHGQLLWEGRLSPNACWEVGELAGGWYQLTLQARKGEKANLVFLKD